MRTLVLILTAALIAAPVVAVHSATVGSAGGGGTSQWLGFVDLAFGNPATVAITGTPPATAPGTYVGHVYAGVWEDDGDGIDAPWEVVPVMAQLRAGLVRVWPCDIASTTADDCVFGSAGWPAGTIVLRDGVPEFSTPAFSTQAVDLRMDDACPAGATRCSTRDVLVTGAPAFGMSTRLGTGSPPSFARSPNFAPGVTIEWLENGVVYAASFTPETSMYP